MPRSRCWARCWCRRRRSRWCRSCCAPEDFYRPSHATIYRTILEMYGGGESIDSITLTNALSTRGVLDEVGGRAIVHTLASTVPAAANARHYAQIVSDAATCRSLIQAGTQIAELGFERIGEPPELVDRAEQIVFSIADQRISPTSPPSTRCWSSRSSGSARCRVGQRDHRRAQRVSRPRPDHGRLPGVEPDHPRRPPRHGQDVARAQHRRPPRRPRAAAGGDLLARDVAGRGHPAADVRRGQGRLPAPAHRRPGRGDWAKLTNACDQLLARRRSTSTTRPASRRSRSGQDPPPAGAGRTASCRWSSSTTCS